MKTYANYAWDRAAELLAIDSPTGFTKNAAIWVQRAFTGLGYEARITKVQKGSAEHMVEVYLEMFSQLGK